MSLLRVLLVALVVSSVPLAASADEKAPALDLLHPVFFEGPEGWQGMQEIAADRRGDVFLLRSEKLAVYELREPSQPRLALELEETGPSAGHYRPRFAIMGENPGDWLMIGNGIRWFQEGKQQPIEKPDLMAIVVALPEGEPVVLVNLNGMPFYKIAKDEVGPPGAELPLLVKWSGTEWESILVESVEGLTGTQGMQQRFAIMAADGPDLWIARSFAPRLQKVSLNGQLKRELLTDAAVDLEMDDKAKAKLAEKLSGTKPPTNAPSADKPAGENTKAIQTASRRTFHYGMTVADGVVYTVVDVEDDGGFRLRRWDPVRQVFEEVALGLDNLGRVSLAMGRDGLHIAQYDSRKGRAFIPNEDLEFAAWRPVEGVLLDGFPLSSVADEEPQHAD